MRPIDENLGVSRRPSRKIAVAVATMLLVGTALLSSNLIGRLHAKQDETTPPGYPRVGGSAISQQPHGSALLAVDASSPDNVWVLGEEFRSGAETHRALFRWDGGHWRRLDGPVPPIRDIAVVSPTDVWGIGGDIGQARIFHWNGTAWMEAAHRDPPGASFSGIDALSADDVWVVGTRFGAEYVPNTVGNDTLIEHWDGGRWSVLPSPNRTRRSNWLEGVVALSPADAWAAGYSEEVSEGPKSMTLHWDGSAWAIVPSPDPGSAGNVLWGVGEDGSGEVWAFGHSWDDSDAELKALYMRWDDKAWGVVPPPRGGASHQSPGAIDGSQSNDVWAVGSDATGSFLIAHWGGSMWREVRAELPAGSADANLALHDVVTPSPDDAWAIGSYQLTKRMGSRWLVEYHPVLEHWGGGRWRLVQLPAADS